MKLKTSNTEDIKPYLNKLYIPQQESHKGMNGKGLIIGGSELFHSASLWAAEIATHFLDMVHYSSTEENNQIFINLKTKFRNGIVVHKKDLLHYVEEDDAILIGPGMVRSESSKFKVQISNFENILKIEDEAEYAAQLTHYLLQKYPHKKFVIDAGALQMMDVNWLKDMEEKPIITPHQIEFERIFNTSIQSLSIEEKASKVESLAKEHNCIILLKAISDIISNGSETVIVEGGNQGLTKGGSGDILSGLTMSFFTKTDAFEAAILASYLEKRTGDELLKNKAYWYNMEDLINKIPEVVHFLLKESKKYKSF